LFLSNFRLLEDGTHSAIVDWGAGGKSFVVKEPSEFAQKILPMLFKHKNFQSFVRQLNKYDFHKIKGEAPIKMYGELASEFQHPKFQAGRVDLLEDISRKKTVKGAKAGIAAIADPAVSTAAAAVTAATTSATALLNGSLATVSTVGNPATALGLANALTSTSAAAADLTGTAEGGNVSHLPPTTIATASTLHLTQALAEAHREIADLKERFKALAELQTETADHLQKLSNNYLGLVNELISLKDLVVGGANNNNNNNNNNNSNGNNTGNMPAFGK
jgi:hypothetical protein